MMRHRIEGWRVGVLMTASLLTCCAVLGQSVSISADGAAPNDNAMLDVRSPGSGNGKGLLIPRVTEAQRTTADAGLAGGLLDGSGNLRGGAAQGLLVYQTDGTQGFYYNSSATTTPAWVFIDPASTGGTVTSVTAGTGLDGGVITTTGTISLSDSGVTSGTYPKVTVDVKGRVTAGATLTDADVPALPISKITNLQTTLDGKQPAITGAATTITGTDLTASRALVSDGLGKVVVSSVTDAEIGHLTGVTSSIQTQLNGKQATITGAATTITGADLTASKALVSDGSGKVGVSSVSDVELGYLGGTTSSVQTQLNGKVGLTGDEAVAGIKTFGSFPLTPSAAPTTDYQAANKKYVDDQVAAGGFFWQEVTGTSVSALSNNGYVANNPSLVTVTLPSTPAVGDIIRVTGAGAGGWKIAQNTGQSAFTATAPYQGWTELNPDNSFVKKTWKAAALSADGSVVATCATYSPTSGDYVYTSSDSGVSWTKREPAGAGVPKDWMDLDMSADGSKLIAAEYNTTIYASADGGATWSSVYSGIQWQLVTISDDGQKMACSDGAYIYASTDGGSSWSDVSPTLTTPINDMDVSGNGSVLVAVADDYDIAVSTNFGTSWSYVDPASAVTYWASVSVSTDGSKIVAGSKDVNYGTYISTNSGTSWTTMPAIGNFVYNAKQLAISGDGSTILVGAGAGFQTSDSGGTWTTIPYSGNGVAVSQNGKVGAALPVGTNTVIYGGPVGGANTAGGTGYIKGAKQSAIELQYIGSGQFVPLSQSGDVIYR